MLGTHARFLNSASCASRMLVCVALAGGCASPPAAKPKLGQIPDVTTSAEPEWLPFAIRAGSAAELDPREKHLGELREITTSGDASRVAWSPDGKRVIYVAGSDPVAIDLGSGSTAPADEATRAAAIPSLSSSADVRVLVSESSGALELAKAPVDSPDQARIAWVDASRAHGPLLAASVAGSPREGRNRVTVAPETSRTPAFLPDSHRLAFACDVDDAAFQIYVVDLDAPRADGSLPARTRVTFAEGGSEAPAFSPDGRHLAFVSRRHDHRASAERHVFVARWVEDP